MIQLSKNEWDPLRSVIVGIADDAKIPKLEKVNTYATTIATL